MLSPGMYINRLLWKYRTTYARERTKLEKEMFWAAPARSIAPATLEEHKSGDYVVVNKGQRIQYKRGIVCGIPPAGRLNGYPAGLTENFMSRLTELATGENQLMISLKLRPINPEESTKMFNTANFKNEVRQSDSKAKHQKHDERVVSLIDENLIIERKRNKENINTIIEGNKKQFHCSLILVMKSKTVDGLFELESSVTSIIQSEGVEFEIPDYNQLETYLAAQPYNINPDYTEIQLFSPYAAVLAPGTDPNSNMDTEGLFFGFDSKTNQQIFIDINKLGTKHLIGVGPSQSGKTFTLLLLLYRAYQSLGYNIIYITPKVDKNTNHRAIVDYLGKYAELIDIGRGGRNINPLQILYHEDKLYGNRDKTLNYFNDWKALIIQFLKIWFEDTGTQNMSNFIDYSLNAVYQKKGIYGDVLSSWKDADWPVMNDLISFWKSELKHTDSNNKKTINAVLDKTYTLSEGGILSYINNKTDLDITKPFTIFDLSLTPKIIRDPMYAFITGIMSHLFNTDADQSTIIAVDEASVFLKNPLLLEFILTLVTQGASQKVFLWLLTQQATDLIREGVADVFQTNVVLKLILGGDVNPDNIGPILKYFNLNPTSVQDLYDSIVGEGLLGIGNEYTRVRFEPAQLEHDIIKGKYLNSGTDTDKPDSEFQIIDERLVSLVMDQGFCLDKWAPGNTTIQSWVQEPVANAFGAGMISSYVRDEAIPQNMSLDHFATVVEIAGWLVLNDVEDVRINHSNDVDISFKSRNKTYAIEFERDGSHTEEQLKNKRFNALKKYDSVMFVCASRYYPKLSGWLGDDFVTKRGQGLQDYLESV